MEIPSSPHPRAAKASMFVVCLLVIAAFVPSVSTASPGGETRELRVAIQQDIPDFNIFNLASNTISKRTVLDWAFEGISAIDYDGLPYPRLAESWSFDEGTLTVTIELRQGVTFHDGSPLTADDVVFTYQAVRDGTVYYGNIVNAFDGNDDGYVSSVEMAAGVWKIGDHTVGMQMAKPYGQFFINTLTVPIIPQEIWQDHVEFDGIVDVLWNDPLAATGTGPFRYANGLAGDYRVMEKNYAYWGTAFVTPNGYYTYPPNIDRLYFKVYSSTYDIALALKNGAVDHSTWTIPSSMIPTLEGNPGVDISYLEDNGYFYLAFNEKLEPMNRIDFRRAISHLTDKERIVNEFMGGLGVVGSAVEPPYWTSWYNESVITYSYDDPFDDVTTIPEDLLDSAGFVDVNGDGWRDLPDGTLMDEITILTPPGDYDPVRIKAGEAIAKNMREVGLNAEAEAIDFDTLVTRLNSMDFQMLIIGWSLTSDPVTNVFDVLGPKAASNTFGFWSEADPNPFYNDLWGVSTLADAETQAIADEVDLLGDIARSCFDVVEQVVYTRWAQGLISNAVPIDPLYYRVNALATTDHWTGWVPSLGILLNMFSLSELEEVPTDRMYKDASEGINIGLSVPTTILSGHAASWGHAIVIDELGYPVEGAQVTLDVDVVSGAFSVDINNVTGTTDSIGRVWFEMTCTGEGVGVLNASAQKDTWTDYDSTVITVRPIIPNSLSLHASLDTAVIGPGEQAELDLWVTNELGDLVERAEIQLDESLLGWGSVDTPWVLTDLTGHASMTYTAPATINAANSHLLVKLVLSVSKMGYEWTSSVTKELLVYNDAAPDWVMTRVVSVSTTALSNAGNTSTITVEAVDASGSVMVGHMLQVSYSDESLVMSPTTSVMTDGAGIATVSVEMKNMAASGALKVNIGDVTVLSSISASVTLTFVGSVPPAEEMYGGYITYTEAAQYLDPMGAIEATVWAWDCAGSPADVTAAMVLSGTPYGTFTWSDDVNWDTTWEYLGIVVSSYADDSDYVSSGLMNTPFDEDNYWEWYYDAGGLLWWPWGMMTGVDIVSGSYTFNIYGIDVTHLDLVGDIFVVPDGLGFLNDTTYFYQIDGATSIVSEYVIGRSYQAVSINHEVGKPVLTAYPLSYDFTAVTGYVTDENGDPVVGADMLVYENSLNGNRQYGVYPNWGSPISSMPVTTDVDGRAVATISAVGYQGPTDSSLRAEVFVKPSFYGAISLSSHSQVFIHPQATRCALTPVWDPQPVGSMVPITVHAVNSSWLPAMDVSVSLLAGVGSIVQYATATDLSGHVTLSVDTAGIRASEGGFMPISVSLGGPAFDQSGARLMVPMQNIRPVVEILDPEDGGELSGDSVTVHVVAYDADGIYYLGLRVDGGSWIPLPGTPGNTTWNVTYELTDLPVGTHIIEAEAYDHYDVSGSDSVSTTVLIPELGYPALIAIAMLIGIVALTRISRRRRKERLAK